MPSHYSKKMFAHCVEEVGRLGSQAYFKNDDVLLADLAKALARIAEDEEHATRMISTWKDATKDMLHQSALPQLADQTRTKPELAAGCKLCLGADFVIIEVDGYTGAKRCCCSRGRELAKIDQERRNPTIKPFDFSTLFADGDEDGTVQ